VKLTVDELTAQASHIVTGRVTETKSQWNANRSRINTLVSLLVDDLVKGSLVDKRIVVQLPGGKVGNTAEWVEDSPSFGAGERVLVFLVKQDTIFSVVGGFQGKLVIENGKIAGSNLSLYEFIDQIKRSAVIGTGESRK